MKIALSFAVAYLFILSFMTSCNGESKDTKKEQVGLFLIWQDRKWGYINIKGEIVISPQFTDAQDFIEGIAMVETHVKQEGKWGYIDKTGKYVINPQFDDARSFSEGLAAVNIGSSSESPALFSHKEGKWGYIDKTGKYIINPQFDYAMPFSERLAAVLSGAKIHFLFIKEGKWGYIDKTGKYVIESQFEDIPGEFSEGLADICFEVENIRMFPGSPTGRKCGYIDKTGKIVIKPEFDYASVFSKGLAGVRVGKQRGYIDKSGNYVWKSTN